jgi:uncharacterized protein YbjT (DUF2867 family)
MNVILFGGTGMVGQGVLRECLRDARVQRVLMVVRKEAQAEDGEQPAKVVGFVNPNFYNWHGAEIAFEGYDACFFCLGTSAVGMKEAEYRKITYDLTLGVADVLLRSGVKTFVYVSGQGTNEHGRAMWARVKGATESALMRLPFESVYCFRPGFIQPLDGIRSKTGWYQAMYTATGWLYPVMRRVARRFLTTTREVGRAMIAVAADGYEKRLLEAADIQAAARR